MIGDVCRAHPKFLELADKPLVPGMLEPLRDIVHRALPKPDLDLCPLQQKAAAVDDIMIDGPFDSLVYKGERGLDLAQGKLHLRQAVREPDTPADVGEALQQSFGFGVAAKLVERLAPFPLLEIVGHLERLIGLQRPGESAPIAASRRGVKHNFGIAAATLIIV